MGLVYRVNQIFLNKELALKTIDKSSMAEVVIRRFQQEARTAFSLDHPNIVAVNDFGVLDDGTPFLVMELINGETLSDRLKRTGILTLEQAIPIFVQLCFGLAYAHECGVVHRDIKPGNIMLLKGIPLGVEGSLKILDFGIAKFTQHEGGEIQSLTRTGEIFGSPLYMSPEQCLGGRIDQRADIYSLGCVFYEALTGAPPCVGENALATMMKHQSETPLTLKQASLGAKFPQSIEDIVATMLEKSPDRRYQNLGDVVHDLEALRRGDAVSGIARHTKLQAGAGSRTISISRKNFYSLVIAVAVVSAAMAGVFVYMLRQLAGGEAQNQPQRQPERQDFHMVISTPPADMPDESDCYPVPPEELAELLKDYQPDHRLKLGNKKLSDESFRLIADTPWINKLKFQSCDISNDSLGRLAKLHLSRIDLWHSTFNDAGASRLYACKELTDVRADSTNITDRGASRLAMIKGLLILDLAGTKITDKSLSELAHCKNLIDLNLKNTKVTSKGLSELAHSHIQFLNLESTQIDDAGLEHVAEIKTLEKIILSRTRVTMQGIERLCRSAKNLKLITVQHCPGVGPKEVQKLREEFPEVQFPGEVHHTGEG
jgi:tRNA A-37 threonylcarbamoyl transferase component Bud32